LRWASSVALVLAGCNQVFGNAPVHGIDAAFFDAAIDALPTCPTGAAPSYSRDFFQLVVDDCASVTVAGGNMLALCGEGVGTTPAYGPIGDMLVAAPQLAVHAQFEPRLSRDGQRASFVVPVGGNLASLVVFHRSGSSWISDPDIVTGGSITGASEISNGPNARVLVGYADGLHELEEQGGTWTDIATHALGFSGTEVQGPHLSGDAMRVWFTKGPAASYFDRSELDVTFTARGTIAGSEGLDDADLTDDCGLMYFATLSRIWVAHP
jgi:hypothetical protein